jgi:hypothetical protein
MLDSQTWHDAIQTKPKEIKYANNLHSEDSDRISLPQIDGYLTESINEFEITLRQHFHLKQLPHGDRRLLDSMSCM